MARFKNVDITLWNVPLIINFSSIYLITYLTSHCVDYIHAKWVDEDLLGAYYEDFKEWTEDIFSSIPVEFKRTLKTILRNGGVYTGIWNEAIGKQLTNLLKANALPDWQDGELARSEISPRSQWYQRYTELKTVTLIARSTPAPPDADELGGRASQVPGRNPPAAETTQDTTRSTDGIGNTSTDQQDQQPANPLLYNQTAKMVIHDPYHDLPPQNVPNEALDLSIVTNFSKGWQAEDTYKGDLYEVFDDTIRTLLKMYLSA
jgi:hypothetical protein